jgi:hypothetical protein
MHCRDFILFTASYRLVEASSEETATETLLVDELGWHSNCFDRFQDTEVTTTAPSAACAGQGTTGFDGQCRLGQDSTQRVAIETSVAQVPVLAIATRLHVEAIRVLENQVSAIGAEPTPVRKLIAIDGVANGHVETRGVGRGLYPSQRGGASCSRGRVARLQSSAGRSSSEQRRSLVFRAAQVACPAGPWLGPIPSGTALWRQLLSRSCRSSSEQRRLLVPAGTWLGPAQVARLQSSAGRLSKRYLAWANPIRHSVMAPATG